MPVKRKRFLIADTIIEFKSAFFHEEYARDDALSYFVQRYHSFWYEGESKSDILVQVKVVDKLPKPGNYPTAFVTYHPLTKEENWRILNNRDHYTYTSPLAGREQMVMVNRSFDRATAYLRPHPQKGYVWNSHSLVYDFLQVLLINYFAFRQTGIFLHAVAVKDIDGKGLVFAGKSGRGKSTTARIWDRYSRAAVLNDDRIIVRKKKSGYVVYGSPWHGDFSDFLESRVDSARCAGLFAIHQSDRNRIKSIFSPGQAFKSLYPAVIPVFWDKGLLSSVIGFTHGLTAAVPCFDLGFVNDKAVIGFVRDNLNRQRR
jgi:hypothetical protein